MSITLFGTCRIDGIKNSNKLNNLINYTHSTKEVIQQIKFLLGEKCFPPPFDKLCFRTGIVKNNPIVNNPIFTKLFSESTVCVIEICSEKTYVYDDFYLHHLCVDTQYRSFNRNTPKVISDNFKCIKQTYDEIENDILEIKKLLEPRKLIFVTHYNAKKNGEYLKSRSNLITFLSEICEKYNIPLVKPSEVLKDYEQEQVMKKDLGHYTPLGFSKFSDYMNNYLDENE
jgi:hypothetical protein